MARLVLVFLNDNLLDHFTIMPYDKENISCNTILFFASVVCFICFFYFSLNSYVKDTEVDKFMTFLYTFPFVNVIAGGSRRDRRGKTNTCFIKRRTSG